MGIISGYICVVCIFILVAKFVTKRLGLKRIDCFLMKTHKYAASAFLVIAMIHLILVIPVLDTRGVPVIISGICIIAFGLLLILLCHVLKNRKIEKKCHQILSLMMVLAVAFHVTFYFDDLNRYKKIIGGISVEEVDLNTISAGEYIGEFDAGYIYAKVRVTVTDRRIDKIEILEHNNERGEKAETIVNRMMQENRIDVDAISSATNSSLVIKKACENALKNNKRD